MLRQMVGLGAGQRLPPPVGLITGQALAPATPVVIRLLGPNPRASMVLPACVIHTTPEADGTWRIGCDFSRRLTDGAFDALMGRVCMPGMGT